MKRSVRYATYAGHLGVLLLGACLLRGVFTADLSGDWVGLIALATAGIFGIVVGAEFGGSDE